MFLRVCVFLIVSLSLCVCIFVRLSCICVFLIREQLVSSLLEWTPENGRAEMFGSGTEMAVKSHLTLLWLLAQETAIGQADLKKM